MNYSVYMHENKKNKKRYFGITSQDCKERWKNGNGYKGCTVFYNAIKKYGWDGFTHKILLSGLSKEKAEEMEKKLIKQFKTQEEAYGYNILEGGAISEMSIDKMQEGKWQRDTEIVLYHPDPTREPKYFDNIKEASEKIGLDMEYLLECCRKRKKLPGDFYIDFRFERKKRGRTRRLYTDREFQYIRTMKELGIEENPRKRRKRLRDMS